MANKPTDIGSWSRKENKARQLHRLDNKADAEEEERKADLYVEKDIKKFFHMDLISHFLRITTPFSRDIKPNHFVWVVTVLRGQQGGSNEQ